MPEPVLGVALFALTKDFFEVLFVAALVIAAVLAAILAND